LETRILDTSQLDEAVALLRRGDVVALPTETVYGLAADATSDGGVGKVFTAKGRPARHPLIVHLACFDEASDWAADIPDSARVLAEHFWPGPLTMVLPGKASVNPRISGGLETIALRVPGHPVALAIIRNLGNGIVAPSANAHKKTSPTQVEHVLKTLSGRIAAVVDGGPCSVGIESTIVDLTGERPVILRPGAITVSMIEHALQLPLDRHARHDVRAPGNMPVHYQPEKPVLLLSRPELVSRLAHETRVAVMHHSDLEVGEGVACYRMSIDRADYARSMYRTLHRIDATDVARILVEAPPAGDDWADINDRLSKAAASESAE
jgi:L-threonylcarbamoyladenylate synthase